MIVVQVLPVIFCPICNHYFMNYSLQGHSKVLSQEKKVGSIFVNYRWEINVNGMQFHIQLIIEAKKQLAKDSQLVAC